MLARLNSLDREIAIDDSRCAADARQMKDELERKDHRLSTIEKEADIFLKVLLTFVPLYFNVPLY